MELHQALKHIIRCEGQDILTDLRLINILSDLNAYDNIQGSKYILRAIIDDGIASTFKQQGGFTSKAQDIAKRFCTTTGFNEDAVLRIFDSMAFGLDWISSMPSRSPQPNNPCPTAPNPSSKPQLTPNSANLNLTSSQLDNKSESFKRKYAEDAELYLDSIIEILGEPKKELGANISANVAYSAEYNNFDFNIEVTGGIKCRFQYNFVFVVVFKSVRGKVLAKEEIYVDKGEAKAAYFVKDVHMVEDEFHRVCEVGGIKIYWKKD